MRSCRRRPGPAGNRVTEQTQHGPDSRLVGVIPTALSACRYKVSGCQGDTHFWPDWPDLHPMARLARVARLAPNGLHCALAVLHTHTLTTPGVSTGPAGAQQGTETCAGLDVADESARSSRG